MLKRIISLILILGLSAPALAEGIELSQDVGNSVNEKEYPESDKVLPSPSDKKDKMVIEGSVEKNIDMTLERCIDIALGNNPQINAAFQDILASDARIKLVWSI